MPMCKFYIPKATREFDKKTGKYTGYVATDWIDGFERKSKLTLTIDGAFGFLEIKNKNQIEKIEFYVKNGVPRFCEEVESKIKWVILRRLFKYAKAYVLLLDLNRNQGKYSKVSVNGGEVYLVKFGCTGSFFVNGELVGQPKTINTKKGSRHFSGIETSGFLEKIENQYYICERADDDDE